MVRLDFRADWQRIWLYTGHLVPRNHLNPVVRLEWTKAAGRPPPG